MQGRSHLHCAALVQLGIMLLLDGEIINLLVLILEYGTENFEQDSPALPQ